MWIPKYLRLSHAYAKLETLTDERTAELQMLTQRLLRVQDEERRKLARDLHDSTGQTLCALAISVSRLREHCEEMPAVLERLNEITQLADQALEEIRTMSYLLHPPLLDEVGFSSAAEWYIAGFAKRSGINVKAGFTSPSVRLPKKVEIALFRVLQESLTNVHRHSGATDASVFFEQSTSVVSLEVRDFGKGISEERIRMLRGVTAETGVGLAGMRERMHELNGTLELESDGCGTSMRARVPLCVTSSLSLISGGNGRTCANV